MSEITYRATVADVEAAITSERIYQDQRWGHDDNPPNHVVGEYILYALDYYDETVNQANGAGMPGMGHLSDDALHSLRKVATIGVRCLEQHWLNRRFPHQDVPNKPRTRREIFDILSEYTRSSMYINQHQGDDFQTDMMLLGQDLIDARRTATREAGDGAALETVLLATTRAYLLMKIYGAPLRDLSKPVQKKM